MKRRDQFQDTISRLDVIVQSKLQGDFLAEAIKKVFEYSLDVDRGNDADIEWLQSLCDGGVPFRDIETFDEETINSIYDSFEEMKNLLREKTSNE